MESDIQGLAINITDRPVICQIARKGSVKVRVRGGPNKGRIQLVPGQEYQPLTVEPGEVVDVGGYAMSRAVNPENAEDVPTVIEQRSRGQVLPIWKAKAKTHRARVEARQAATESRKQKRTAAMDCATKAAEEGLAKRNLDAGLVQLCLMAYGERIVIAEDDETARVEWPTEEGSIESLPLDKGLDCMAMTFRSHLPKSPDVRGRQKK